MRSHGYAEECEKSQVVHLGVPKQLTFTCVCVCVCVCVYVCMCVCVVWCVRKEGKDGVASLTMSMQH